jgi:hypothetical protein
MMYLYLLFFIRSRPLFHLNLAPFLFIVRLTPNLSDSPTNLLPHRTPRRPSTTRRRARLACPLSPHTPPTQASTSSSPVVAARPVGRGARTRFAAPTGASHRELRVYATSSPHGLLPLISLSAVLFFFFTNMWAPGRILHHPHRAA